MGDLFQSINEGLLDHGEGLYQLKHFARSDQLIPIIEGLSGISPFRQMMTPMGHPTQVSMLNCGPYGWVSNESGYGYSAIDPITQRPWPQMPPELRQICNQVIERIGLEEFQPDACLINRYEIGMAMGRHLDKDEKDFSQPIVSISLGLPAVFQVFGQHRSGKAKEFLLESGDVFVMSGNSRRFYHGIKPVKADPLAPNETLRYNLTFRKSH